MPHVCIEFVLAQNWVSNVYDYLNNFSTIFVLALTVYKFKCISFRIVKGNVAYV